MKKIIVPTDFSSESSHTLQLAAEFLRARRAACHVLLLHTYLVPSGTPREKLVEENDRIKRFSLGLLEKEKELFLKRVGNPSFALETSSRMGKLENVLAKLLEQDSFDLVILGKREDRQETVAESLLRASKAPILYLPTPGEKLAL